MKRLHLNRHALGVIALLLAGCGSQVAPTGAMPQAVTRPSAMHGESWMLPEAKSEALLYISNLGNGTVTIYAYPQGKLVGALTGFSQPDGECVDNMGNVFITNFKTSNIIEYPHGSSKSSATITDGGEHPQECSVDPVNGDLAVDNAYTVSNGAGSISLYDYEHRRGWHLSETYSDSRLPYMGYCGYDNSGDLFVDGLTGSPGRVIIAELPAGRKTFTNIALNHRIESPGQVQWYGDHLAVADTVVDLLYEFTIRGRSGRLVGSTPLHHAKGIGQFWISDGTVVAADYAAGDVGFWRYPAGGRAQKIITDGVDSPAGATISDAR
jgi:DNA-binding beta-propeller fold protein YncE